MLHSQKKKMIVTMALFILCQKAYGNIMTKSGVKCFVCTNCNAENYFVFDKCDGCRSQSIVKDGRLMAQKLCDDHCEVNEKCCKSDLCNGDSKLQSVYQESSFSCHKCDDCKANGTFTVEGKCKFCEMTTDMSSGTRKNTKGCADACSFKSENNVTSGCCKGNLCNAKIFQTYPCYTCEDCSSIGSLTVEYGCNYCVSQIITRRGASVERKVCADKCNENSNSFSTSSSVTKCCQGPYCNKERIINRMSHESLPDHVLGAENRAKRSRRNSNSGMHLKPKTGNAQRINLWNLKFYYLITCLMYFH